MMIHFPSPSRVWPHRVIVTPIAQTEISAVHVPGAGKWGVNVFFLTPWCFFLGASFNHWTSLNDESYHDITTMILHFIIQWYSMHVLTFALRSQNVLVLLRNRCWQNGKTYWNLDNTENCGLNTVILWHATSHFDKNVRFIFHFW